MINLENNMYFVQCDQCKSGQTIQASAYREEQLKQLLNSYGWALGTERGDLCRKCARLWRSGKLNQEVKPQ